MRWVDDLGPEFTIEFLVALHPGIPADLEGGSLRFATQTTQISEKQGKAWAPV
jgi:hypothetical protein